MKEFDKNHPEDEEEKNESKDSSSEDDNEHVNEVDDENEDESSDEEDNLSDLRSSEDESPSPIKSKENGKAETKPIISEVDREKMMKTAATELPYTFDLPDSYEELEQLLTKYNVENQNIIFERMIKSNHPKILPENRSKFSTLFAYMMQYINDTFQMVSVTTIEQSFRLLKLLSGHIFEVFNIDPIVNSQCFRDVIIEKYSDFHEQQQQPPNYPSLETLIFFKLNSTLFSTSDYRHSIITPSFAFIGEMLSRCRIENRSDIASGLFLVTIVHEYTKLSKRYLPAALNFLCGIVHLCIKKRPIEVYSDVMLPFQLSGEQSSLLVLSDGYNKRLTFNVNDCYLKSSDLLRTQIDDNFRVRCLNSTLRITIDMLQTISDNKCVQYLIEPFDKIYRKLMVQQQYPEFVNESLQKCLECIDSIMEKPLEFLEPTKKSPIKSLRMMEPKFDVVYDDKRSHKPAVSETSKSKMIRNGLVRKIKNETRGAIREIRRDNAFLAKIQHKQQQANDAERKEKVRRLFSEASIQQGELNAMDRKKKHL